MASSRRMDQHYMLARLRGSPAVKDIFVSPDHTRPKVYEANSLRSINLIEEHPEWYMGRYRPDCPSDVVVSDYLAMRALQREVA